MSIDEVVKHFGKGYKNIKIMTPEEFLQNILTFFLLLINQSKRDLVATS